MKILGFLLFCILASLGISPAHASWQTEVKLALKNGAGLITDDSGKIIFQHRADTPMIPASIMKIATSALALNKLGGDFRFETDFFVTPKNELVIKGYGDPYLVSEEIQKIAQALRGAGLREVRNFLLDTSFFSEGITTVGADSGVNPYNALNGALMANFNTVHVKRLSDGRVVSAEPQTPITPIAVARGKKVKIGQSLRINLGENTQVNARYFAELLCEFLKQEGVVCAHNSYLVKAIPPDARKLYTHQSSKKMSEILSGLLDFSANHSTNQLLLYIGAKFQGAPANVERGLVVFRDFLKQNVGWNPVRVFDGAGLSRQNKVTALQMGMLLDYFKDYRELLPVKKAPFRAKTGTLTGVSTLAGYFPIMAQGQTKWYRFVILFNEQVSREHRYKVAELMRQGVGSQTPKFSR